MTDTKIVALTLRISSDVLARLDEAAYRKRMSRTAFMRESLTRNIAYSLDVESKVPDATGHIRDSQER